MSLSKNNDWFMPAMRQLGGLNECLSQVIRIEQQRLAFAQGLQQSLCQYAGKSTDSLTELKRRGRELQQTIELRLGMLSPEREAPWFRAGSLLESGPFAPKVSQDPILLPFQPQQALELKQQIVQAWSAGNVPDFNFVKQGPCVWLELLEQNACFMRIMQVRVLSQTYSLLDLAEQLPDHLESQSLRLFLLNVKSLALAVREQLADMYRQLFQATAPFLERQHERALQAEQEAFRQTRLRDSADDIREHLKSRRQEKWQRVSDEERQALDVLELNEWPDAALLKRKFRELAMRYHPDRDEGDAERFRRINAAYQRLHERMR